MGIGFLDLLEETIEELIMDQEKHCLTEWWETNVKPQTQLGWNLNNLF